MSKKDNQFLAEAYSKIVNERLKQVTDGGFAHGAWVGTHDDEEDYKPTKQPAARPAKPKSIPKYSKLATGKDYPEVDEWIHMWYTDSPTVGGNASYAEMEGPPPDMNIEHWLEGDKNAINFFKKNKSKLHKVAYSMYS